MHLIPYTTTTVIQTRHPTNIALYSSPALDPTAASHDPPQRYLKTESSSRPLPSNNSSPLPHTTQTSPNP
jgi:hypothetical protein